MRTLTALLLAVACGSSEENPPVPLGLGQILGTVSTFGLESDLHVVAGARVSAEGIETVSDHFGRFMLEGLPTDTPIALRVRGPERDLERYAENRIVVTIPSDSGVITPDVHLIRACTFLVDGTIGGNTRCTEDDRASFVFPAGSVASERVEATIAALDPSHLVDRLGFPAGDSDRSVAVLGGISVELTDALDGTPLELAAPVTARFELAPSDDEVELEWFDGREWIAQPSGRIVSEGDRRFYELQAAHFSSYRAVSVRYYDPNACITFTTAICHEAGCERTVWLSIVDLVNGRVVRGHYGPSSACVPAYSAHVYQLYATHLDPTFGLGASAPIHQTTRRVVVPPSARLDHECISDCVDAGNIVLTERAPGCVTGTLLTACGLDCVEQYAGPLDVSFEGQRIATVEIPPECSGEVCIPVPLFGAPATVELRTPSGHELSFVPDVASRGKACDPFACAPSPECQDLGPTLLGCGNGLAQCLEAKMTADVVENAPPCLTKPEAPHLIRANAMETIGRAAGYEWKLYRLEDQGATLIETKRESLGLAQFCVAQGAYRVTLTANTNTTFHLPLRSSTSRDVEAGVGLIALSITASPGTVLMPGMPATLTVVTPGDPSQYTFFWWRGSADDPSYVGDAISVDVTPRRAMELFGVFASKNGVRVGQAQILIQVDTTSTIYLEVETTDIRPIPDQPVTFRPMTIGGGMRDIVSCLYPNITRIRWLLTDVATGDFEETLYQAPAGQVLACDRTLQGPIVERRFYEGMFRMEVAVEADDGRTGAASLDFEVGF